MTLFKEGDKKMKNWRPHLAERYFFVAADGSIYAVDNRYDELDRRLLAAGNCFPCYDAARKVAAEIERLSYGRRKHSASVKERVDEASNILQDLRKKKNKMEIWGKERKHDHRRLYRNKP